MAKKAKVAELDGNVEWSGGRIKRRNLYSKIQLTPAEVADSVDELAKTLNRLAQRYRVKGFRK